MSSFMNRRKRMEPSWDPWGTPDKATKRWDIEEPKRTMHRLFER